MILKGWVDPGTFWVTVGRRWEEVVRKHRGGGGEKERGKARLPVTEGSRDHSHEAQHTGRRGGGRRDVGPVEDKKR